MTSGVISLPATRQKGEIRLINEPSCAILVPPILAARSYVSPRARPITPEEAETRRIAYALKRGGEIQAAAREMVSLLPPDLPTLTFVPVPASTGSIEANLILARAIAAEYSPQARVVLALRRSMPVESSCARRRRGLPGLTAAAHKFMRVGGWFSLPVFLVDNVVTTGATLAAARHALGFGMGLVFADASPIHQSAAKRVTTG